VKPVVQASLASVNTSSLPSTISAILTWNGTAGATLTYETAGDGPGQTLTIAAEVPSAVATPVSSEGPRSDAQLRVPRAEEDDSVREEAVTDPVRCLFSCST
jgi:hypothetical protein